MVQVDYGRDRAVLSFCGDVTDESIIGLVAEVRRLVDEFYYDSIVLEITSSGGSVRALRYFVDAMEAVRAKGVSVKTRALAKAYSAAAVMLSLGDVREAAAGCELMYHASRVADLDCVTSKGAAALQGSLASADHWMMERLAERGLRSGGAPPPPCAETAAALSGGDWRVVRHLCAGRGGAWADDENAGLDGPEALERLRRVVGRCARDVAGMIGLYDALFSMEAAISPALARELRLVDSVAESGASDAKAPPSGGVFRIPEWRAAFGPDGCLDRAVLCRHVLILGETGSGKTASGVLPAVGAMFDRRNPFGCALVVDPKREIDGVLDELRRAGGTEVRLFEPKAGPGGPALNLMAGPQWSVEEDVRAGRYLTAAQRILSRSGGLSSMSPGALLEGKPSVAHREMYWPAEGARLGKTVLALALMLIHRRREAFAGLGSPRGVLESPTALAAVRRFGEEAGFIDPAHELDRIARRTWEAADDLAKDIHFDDQPDEAEEAEAREASELAESFVSEVRGASLHRLSRAFRLDFDRIAAPVLAAPSTRRLQAAADKLAFASLRCADDSRLRPSPNVLALAGRLLRTLFQVDATKGAKSGAGAVPPGQAASPSRLVGLSRMRLPAAVVAHALRPLAEEGEAAEALDMIEDYWLPLSRTDNQYMGVVTFAQQCFWEFADGASAWTLRFGVEPGGRREVDAGGFDFAAAVDDEKRRTVFLVQPRLGGGRDLIAKALKAGFFEAVLNSPKRLRRGGKMPLVGYVADECHRFATSDEVHGEQSFLDTCRSFGAFCVLACQSVSSLEHAFASGGGGAANGPALSVLVNNAGTKLMFRSTDDATRSRLERLCPEPSSGPKVTAVRPPSTLRPGECYAVTADGRLERRQLEAFDVGRAAARLKVGNRSEPGAGPQRLRSAWKALTERSTDAERGAGGDAP